MNELYQKYEAIHEEIATIKNALTQIEGWAVPALEKIQERSKMNKMLQQCEEDLKIVLSKIAEQAGNELSKLCLVNAYAA